MWNHDFFWEGMSPNGGGKPSGKLAEAIDSAFGSLDEFKTQFKVCAQQQQQQQQHAGAEVLHFLGQSHSVAACSMSGVFASAQLVV